MITKLAKDLRLEFPDIRGFSPRNLQYMSTFAETDPDLAIVQQAVAQIPWSHNINLMEMLKSPEEQLWYTQEPIARGLQLCLGVGLRHQN